MPRLGKREPYGAKNQPVRRRFWKKVDISAGRGGCWPWTRGNIGLVMVSSI